MLLMTELQQPWVYDDGGRAQAGYLFSQAGDCVARAIAIATQTPYEIVVDIIDKACYLRGGYSQTGVYSDVTNEILTSMGWKQVRTNAYLDLDELPAGRLVLELDRHAVAMIDGVIHDTYDPNKLGYRRVYSYWEKRKN